MSTIIDRSSAHDRWVAQLLRLVELVAAAVAGGVEVADVLDGAADGVDDVAFPKPIGLIYGLRFVREVIWVNCWRYFACKSFFQASGIVMLPTD